MVIEELNTAIARLEEEQCQGNFEMEQKSFLLADIEAKMIESDESVKQLKLLVEQASAGKI